MTYSFKKVTFLIFLPVVLFSQERKTWQQFKQDADNFINSNQVNAALSSTSNGDMYFEGTGVLMGLYRVWQATGDFAFLDKALDIAERDIAEAINLEEFYTTHGINDGTYDTPKFPYKGNIMLPNYWRYNTSNDARFDPGGSNPTYPNGYNIYTPPLNEFINYNYKTVAPQGTSYSYNFMEASNAERYRWRHYALDENVYYRYVADMCRVMFNNSSILSLTSGNGRTYQARMNDIVDHLELNIWEKWVEYRINPAHLEWYVYRNKTHMNSHLASTALSLGVITGKQKYVDFVNDFLYDFVNPEDPGQNIAPGIGFLDVINIQNNKAVWASNWSTGGNNQDISHAGNEFNFLIQCYQEGYGENPSSSGISITPSFMAQLASTLKENVIIGDPKTSTSVDYRINTSQSNWFNKNQYAQGLHDMAQYDEDLLHFLDNNMPFAEKKMGGIGDAIYAARIFDGDPPVYPSNGDGGGSIPSNNAPVVVVVGNSTIDLNVGDSYTEQGATWTDIQDGSGTIDEPTTGTVDTETPGKYTLTYSYTDEGGWTDTENRIINVNVQGNNCPELFLNGDGTVRLELELNETYVEQGATWTDAEDGTGDAVVGGDTVDTSIVGTYSVSYTYTDSDNCTRTISRDVVVQDSSNNILYTRLEFVDNSPITVDLDYSGLPPVIREPYNTTQTYYCTASSNPKAAFIDQNGVLTALAAGTTVLTITSCDGSNLTDQITVTIVDSSEGEDDNPEDDEGDISLPNITVSDASSEEGQPMSFIIGLSEPSSEEIVLSLSYTNETADDNDYTKPSQEVIIAPGETEKIVVVETFADLIEEDDETFTIEIDVKQPIPSGKLTLQATGTIINTIVDTIRKLAISPNPARSGSPINISGLDDGTYQISFYNLSGQLLKNDLIDFDGSPNEYILPSATQGLYILNMININDNTVKSKKIFIQ